MGGGELGLLDLELGLGRRRGEMGLGLLSRVLVFGLNW